MPTMGTSVRRNRSIARRASISAISCGVETITAPAGLCFWTIDNCTSPVPGGRSSRSEEHTSELQSLMRISYAVFCLKKQSMPDRTNAKPNEHNQAHSSYTFRYRQHTHIWT